MGRMMEPEAYMKAWSFSLYAAMSVMGREATPSAAAACATAGAILSIRRGSKGFGIRYCGPKARCCPA